MCEEPLGSIWTHFSRLEDPRVNRTKRHKLIDIVVIAVCAVICGADNWVDVANFGRAKKDWLCRFLELPNGIPSHDTFGRVFAHLDPEAFQHCFLEWVQAAYHLMGGQVIAVDGKTLRRSHDRMQGKPAIQMVSAWAEANHLVLGQVKVPDGSAEVTAIPQLLEVLALSGCVVTIDAQGCHKEFAATIVDKGGDYVLALKENQGRLYEDVVSLFDYAHEVEFEKIEHGYYRQVDKGHGRLEIRECWTITDAEFVEYPKRSEQWKNLQTIVMVVAERRVGETVTKEARYFISSLPGNAKKMLQVVRSHWGIENSCHWILDLTFREDESRIRKENGAANYAVLHHIALNLLKQEKTFKGSIKSKRLKAGWDESYLLKVLLQ